jgi:hypothetical protein
MKHNRLPKHIILATATLALLATLISPAQPQQAATNARGSVALVPQSGQTVSYDSSGLNRDDGGLRAGVAWPNPRFTDNNNGTITDNLTKLIWLKNANCPNGALAWQDALDFVAGINAGTNLCGDLSKGKGARTTHQTDWRLPNVRELQSLVDYGQFNPALPAGFPFTSFQPEGAYWSSTSPAANPTFVYAWVVVFGDGYMAFDFRNLSHFVIAVRGGP